jgi:hypothetical protein
MYRELVRFVECEMTRAGLGQAQVVRRAHPDRGPVIPGRKHDVALLDQRLVHRRGDAEQPPERRGRAERTAGKTRQDLLDTGQTDLAAADQALEPVEVGRAAGRQHGQREADRVLDHHGLGPGPAGDVGLGCFLLRGEGFRMRHQLVVDAPDPEKLFQSLVHDARWACK